MSRRTAWIVLATAVTSVLFAAVATSGGVGLWQDPQWESNPADPAPLESGDQGEQPELPPPPDFDEGEPLEIPGWLEAILQVVLVTLAMIASVAALVMAWRRRPRLRFRRRWDGDGDFEPLPDVAAAVVDEAAAQRATLLDGAPRNAIVRCWLRLEQDVAAVGLVRHPADTSVEFTERVLAEYSVDPTAIRDLATLYREARFSEHPLDESARRSALDALDRLHIALTDERSLCDTTTSAT